MTDAAPAKSAGPRARSGISTGSSTTAGPERIRSSRFGFASTAAEVVAGLDLSGRRAVITGASSGIGLETARALAGAGAEVTLAVRDPAAGAEAVGAIGATSGSTRLHIRRLDLADPVSVAAFATDWKGPLDILVNNAGVLALGKRHLTARGWELHFATNHLGHFALTVGLHDALAAAGEARIVSVSSCGHLRSPIRFHDLQFQTGAFDPRRAYSQSKTANVLFAVEITRRWAADGVLANAVHPGAIAETRLTRDMSERDQAELIASGMFTYKNIEQGAATSVFVATSPQLQGVGGRYFEDCAEAAVIDEAIPEGAVEGVASYALDPDNAERLWKISEELLDDGVAGQAGNPP